MGRFEAAISNPLLAGEAVHALFRGGDPEDEMVGAMIMACGSLVWLQPKGK